MPLVHSNRAFERLSGYSTAETYGRNCRFLQGPETERHSVEMIRDTIRAEKAATVLILNYRKDGSRFWNRLQLSPLHDSKGRLEAYLGMQVDITEDVDRIGTENQRQKLETLGRLAGGVAHELNNALQPIRLFSELLRDDEELQGERCRRYVREIVENTRFAEDVVSGILAFGRQDPTADREHDALAIL